MFALMLKLTMSGPRVPEGSQYSTAELLAFAAVLCCMCRKQLHVSHGKNFLFTT